MMKPWTRWQDWGNVALGAVLFFAPWLFGTSDDVASSWNAWALGLLIVSVALWALAGPRAQLAEWSNVILGAWMALAPFVLGFTGLAAAAWTAYLVGGGVLILAAWALVEARRAPSEAAT